MRIEVWQWTMVPQLLLVAILCSGIASSQDHTEAGGYISGTPPWVPLIDQCMNAGGARNDCIAALPPDMHAAFIADERARAAERRALMQLPRTPPRVPAAGELPDIYKSPLSLAGLPIEIASRLANDGCLVPQSLGGRSNVVIAELAAAGQQDVAVICSVGGVSGIRIFWGGPATCPPPAETSPDRALLYKAADWEYSWAIERATPEHIRGYYEQYLEECPLESLPVMIHDGLEHIFAEKGAANLYCHEGQWLRLCGAD